MRRDNFPFTFEPSACSQCKGNCCIGESGYIWISRKEQVYLADHLEMPYSEFQNTYIDRFGGKDSLKEVQIGKDNYACVFFDLTKKQCSIYDFRPQQCRTFPFWTYYKRNPQMVAKECPGIRLDPKEPKSQ